MRARLVRKYLSKLQLFLLKYNILVELSMKSANSINS